MSPIVIAWHDTIEHKGGKKVGRILTRRPDCGFSSHISPARLLGTWWTHEMYLSHPRKTDHLKKKPQKNKHGKPFTDIQNHYLSHPSLTETFLTHFTDSKRTLVSAVYLGGSTTREIKELHQTRDHLILLLSVAQTSIAPKTPGENTLLRVQYQLKSSKSVISS